MREEMNRAERLKAAGEGRRGNTVGFALTVLQRRLASSPEAILRSLERRRKRLEQRRQELIAPGTRAASSVGDRLARLLGRGASVTDDDLDDLTGGRARGARGGRRRRGHRGADDRRARHRDRHALPTWSSSPDGCGIPGTDASGPSCASCCRTTTPMMRRDGQPPQADHLHRAPRHAQLPGRPDPHPARAGRGGRGDPRRRRAARSAARSRRSCSPRTRTCRCSSPPTPPARASTSSAPT